MKNGSVIERYFEKQKHGMKMVGIRTCFKGYGKKDSVGFQSGFFTPYTIEKIVL